MGPYRLKARFWGQSNRFFGAMTFSMEQIDTQHNDIQHKMYACDTEHKSYSA